MTQLGGIVFGVYAGSSDIRMHAADTLGPLEECIQVEGMRDPRNIVACLRDRQLYVADWRIDCIWRVSADDHSYVKWLPTESTTDKFDVESLSLTSTHLLVTSRRRSLRQYSTTDRQLMLVIQLPDYVKYVWHAVETARDTYVAGHEGTSYPHRQYAVSI